MATGSWCAVSEAGSPKSSTFAKKKPHAGKGSAVFLVK
jgi:hypothetical protein